MKPTLFSKMINAFIITSAIAIVCFAIMRHYFDAKTALIFGILLAFMLSVGVSFLSSKRQRRFGLKNAEIQHLKQVAKTLMIYPKNVVDEFFLKVIQKNHPNAKLQNGWIETEKQQIACMFVTKKVDSIALARLLRTAKTNKQKVVFAIEFEPDCSQLGAKLLSAPQVYAILKRNKIFPKTKLKAEKRHPKLPRFFDRSKVLKYISLAVLFYFASLFVIYKNLYLFFAVISLALAFFSLFAKKKKEEFVLE